MKKHLALLFILFSLGSLSAQNLNFKDTNGLKTLLCSKTWIRYALNADSSFSDKILDSIKFYSNGTYYKSGRPKDDTIHYDKDLFITINTGKWTFGSTGRASRSDTATDCINIDSHWSSNGGWAGWPLILLDGHRIKDTKHGKISGNIEKPFILRGGGDKGADWDRRILWQPRRQFKKTATHSNGL
jgi:hypothetical protein